MTLSPTGFETDGAVNYENRRLKGKFSALSWEEPLPALTWANMGAGMSKPFVVWPDSVAPLQHSDHSGRALAHFHAAMAANGEDIGAAFAQLPVPVQEGLTAVGGWAAFAKTIKTQDLLEKLAYVEPIAVTGGPARYDVRERWSGEVLASAVWNGKGYDMVSGTAEVAWAPTVKAVMDVLTAGGDSHEVTKAVESFLGKTAEKAKHVSGEVVPWHDLRGVPAKDVLACLTVNHKDKATNVFAPHEGILLYKNADGSLALSNDSGSPTRFGWAGYAPAVHHSEGGVKHVRRLHGWGLFGHTETNNPLNADLLEGKMWGGVAGLRAGFHLHEFLNTAAEQGMLLATENEGRRVKVYHPGPLGKIEPSRLVVDVIFYNNMAIAHLPHTGKKVEIDYAQSISTGRKRTVPMRQALNRFERDKDMAASRMRLSLQGFKADLERATRIAEAKNTAPRAKKAFEVLKGDLKGQAVWLWAQLQKQENKNVRQESAALLPKIAFWAGERAAFKAEQDKLNRKPLTPEKLAAAVKNGMKISNIQMDMNQLQAVGGKDCLSGTFEDAGGTKRAFRSYDHTTEDGRVLTPGADLLRKLTRGGDGYVQGELKVSPYGVTVILTAVSTLAEAEASKVPAPREKKTGEAR